jgi:plasmid replication initiation protein
MSTDNEADENLDLAEDAFPAPLHDDEDLERLGDDNPSTWRRIIGQSNALVSSSYFLGLSELRLLRLCMSAIDSRKPLRPRVFTIRAIDYAEMYNVSIDAAYLALREASNTLFEREIRFGTTKTSRRIRWVSEIKYHQGMGEVELHFTDQVMPQLTALKGQYTAYRAGEIVNLGSVYSVRIYEWLCQFRSTGWMMITVQDFRDRLNLNDTYAMFKDLRRRVIEHAVQEINRSTDLMVEVSYKKKGRSVHMICFNFEVKDQVQHALQLDPSEEELAAEIAEAVADPSLLVQQ